MHWPPKHVLCTCWLYFVYFYNTYVTNTFTSTRLCVMCCVWKMPLFSAATRVSTVEEYLGTQEFDRTRARMARTKADGGLNRGPRFGGSMRNLNSVLFAITQPHTNSNSRNHIHAYTKQSQTNSKLQNYIHDHTQEK